VDDIVAAGILALEKNQIGIFNLGTAIETDINTIFLKLKEIIKSDCKETHGPAQSGESERSCLDFSKAKEVFGWEPKYRLEESLEKTVNWFKNNLPD
jgi:UDP-glucose 4-epimerase